VEEVKIREAGEGDVGALAGLTTELGYPTSVEEMGRRLAGVSADPSYATLVPERDGRSGWPRSTSSASTKRTER
jgi:hypothetical protein